MRSLIVVIAVFCCTHATAQDNTPAGLANTWQLGFGLGELPTGGSFKPSVTVGYHFSDKLYGGIIYQFRDEISRGSSSFNAQSAGLSGLMNATESVAQRFMLQCRYAPVRFGPYVSAGFVFNGRDTEHMTFDDRSRNIGGVNHIGTLSVTQTRPAGWGLACGIGYQYNFRNGFSANAEWTPAWMQYPKPEYTITADKKLSQTSIDEITTKMNKGFRSSVTNMYKVFHIGLAYRFR